MASVPLQTKAEGEIWTEELSFRRPPTAPQPVPAQATTQPEVPWESVTLNRCLFIAITILVLASGFQKLHDVLHGHKVSLGEEENRYGMIMRRSGALRHRTEPETTLWELIVSWMPSLDDEDEEEEVKIRKRKPKRRRLVKTLSGLRNRPLLDKLLKQKDENANDRKSKQPEQSQHIEEDEEEGEACEE